MKIKNVSAKVIGVMGRDLMPDESMNCNKSVLKNLAVETMVKMGFLEVDDSAEKQKALEEEIRQKILKEQEEAAAKAAANGETGAPAENGDVTEETDAPATPKKPRRATKPAEPAAE